MKNNQDWLKSVDTSASEKIRHIDLETHTRMLFAKALFISLATMSGGFSLFHFFYTGIMPFALITLAAFSVITSLYVMLIKGVSYRLISHLSALGVTLFFSLYLPITQNTGFTFIWIVFAPFFIILLSAWRLGVAYSLALLVIILVLAQSNIGVWQDGDWGQIHSYRLYLAFVLSMVIASLIDIAQSAGFRLDRKIRQTNEMHMSQLHTLSITDALTGLYNRHHFNSVFPDKLEQSKQEDSYLLFFMIDVDYFKAYNDHYGHQAGDDVLKVIADRVKEYMHRHNDYVFRLGGEEFGGFVESNVPEETCLWLSELKKAIEDIHIKHAPDCPMDYVTISGGISYCTSALQETCSTLELYRNADNALYFSKRNGRNRFTVLPLE